MTNHNMEHDQHERSPKPLEFIPLIGAFDIENPIVIEPLLPEGIDPEIDKIIAMGKRAATSYGTERTWDEFL